MAFRARLGDIRQRADEGERRGDMHRGHGASVVDRRRGSRFISLVDRRSEARYQNLSFCLASDTTGITITETETLGLRAFPHDVILDDVGFRQKCIVGARRLERGGALAGPSPGEKLSQLAGAGDGESV